MMRTLAIIVPVAALLGLAACDGPAALTKAKEGECYAVTGREKSGAPKWDKVACAEPGAVAATDAGTTETAAAGSTATAASPACPTVKTPACPTAGVVAVSTGRSAKKRGFFERRTAKSRTTTTSESREYTRVYTPDVYNPPAPLQTQELLGGPQNYSRGDERYDYSYRDDRQAYAPPPPLPPVERYDERQYSERGGRSERRVPPPPPMRPLPPPPPPYDDRAYGGSQAYGGSESYSESRRYADRGARQAPRKGGAREGGAYGYSEQYSSSESERRSYSEQGSSSSYSRYGSTYDPGCRCERGGSNMAPMNGPHFPIDENGYLTWRGKSR